MGKRSNPTLIEIDVVVGEGVQVRSAKRRQVLPIVSSSQIAAIAALLSIRDSVEFIVPAVVDTLQQRKNPAIKNVPHAHHGEFSPVTDDENDDGRHSPFPQEIKSRSCSSSTSTTCHQPPPIACALRQPAFVLNGPAGCMTTKLPLGIPLAPPPSLAPHLMAKVKPINLVVLSSST